MTISEDEYDERFPGKMNYVDWLMNVLKPDELTPKNIDQIVADIRARRANYEAGGKVKKHEPEVPLAKALGLVRKAPTVWRRPL